MNSLLARRFLSCAKLRARPLVPQSPTLSSGPHRQSFMLLGTRTRSSNQRDEQQHHQQHHVKMNASSGRDSRTDEEVQWTNRLHTSSALESMRNSASSELQSRGLWERERALHLPGKIMYPAGGTVLAGMAAAFTLMFVWGINPLTQLERLWSSYLHALSVAPLLTKMCTAGVCTLVGDYLAQVLPFLLKSSEPEAHSDVSNPGGHGTMGKPGSGAPSGGLDQRNIKAFEMSAGPAPQNEFNLTSSANGGLLPGFKYDPARAARFLLFSVFLATPVAHQWFAFLDKAILPDAPTSPVAVLLKMMSDQLFMTPLMTCIFFAAMTALEGHPDRALSTVKNKIKPTLKANYLLWPAAHLVNFGLVPLDLRILYINIVAIFWTVYLSSVAASKSA